MLLVKECRVEQELVVFRTECASRFRNPTLAKD